MLENKDRIKAIIFQNLLNFVSASHESKSTGCKYSFV